MSVRRWSAILVCVLCNVIDGLDLLLASYALPHLPDNFISPSEKGSLISLGFAGMAVGSLFLAPLADRVGRKNVIVASLFVSTASLALTALAPNIEWMLGTRLLTGLAVGTVTPLLFVLADELASEERRSLSVGLVALGYPLGSALGGLVGLFIIKSFDGAWQALFVCGAVISLLVWVLAATSMPESPTFLVSRNNPAAQKKLARIADRLRLADVDPTAARPAAAEEVEHGAKPGLLSPAYRTRTWLLWIGYSAGSTAFYFVNSWTPQLITTASGSAETGTVVGTILSMGGLAGAALFSIVMIRFSPTKTGWIAGISAVTIQVIFALTLPHGPAIVAAAFLGMTLQILQSSYVTTCTRLYPTAIRARAEGLMMGFSRIGTILVPLAVGYVLTRVTANALYLVAAAVMVVSATLIFVLWKLTKQHFMPSAPQSGPLEARPDTSRSEGRSPV
ncbi:MFS transporter [Rhodococcus rhodochrous]|uniref:MFS transporter n=1 Tax=Rhodococcus rhodochrous TaxID=1829 RepID=UPI001E2BB2EA|nr:MFS transporter [Rhodococcus rhodochrous]